MTASELLLDEAAEVIPGGVNTCRRRSEPRICIRSGDGAYIEDLDGRRYVDYHAAYGAIFLGHSHPAVIERVSSAMRETVLFGVGVTEAEVALARAIVRHVPSVGAGRRLQQWLGGDITTRSGSPAASPDARRSSSSRAVTTAFTITCLRNVLSAPEGVGRARPALEGHARGGDRRHPRLPLQRPRRRARGVRAARRPRSPRSSSSRSRTTRPASSPAPASSKASASSAIAPARCSIFDEVITGFRHHIGGFQALAGVMPDLTTLGKAIANGFPIAAIGGRAEAPGALHDQPGRRRPLRRHLQRQRGRRRGRARHDRAARGRQRPRARVRARRPHARRARADRRARRRPGGRRRVRLAVRPLLHGRPAALVRGRAAQRHRRCSCATGAS